jgi:hypothetical protein
MSFAPDYRTARDRFRAAADRLGWVWHAYPVGTAGPAGEELTIDVAASSAPTSGPLVVVSSGLHGVEGLLGSAVQVGLLERWAGEAVFPAGVRCLMLHALNPYGFAWSRRVDADNVDPNRNFLLPGEEYRGCAPAYARLDAFLNRRRAPSRLDPFYPRALWALARDGKPALKEAIVTGQYDYPLGLFFGGRAASTTRRIVEQHMRSWVGTPGSVVHLDFHTGLGKWGACKLLTDEAPSSEQRDWLSRTFGAGVWEAADSQGTAYQARGSFGRWCQAQDFAPGYLFAFAEFGTYGNLRVLAGLRTENQAQHWGRPDDPATPRAKAELRELFCPASGRWRARSLAQGIALVEKALAGAVRLERLTEPVRRRKLE